LRVIVPADAVTVYLLLVILFHVFLQRK